MSGGWSASEIPDLTNKVALVTGSTSGLGFAAAKKLAAYNCKLVLTAKSTEKGTRYNVVNVLGFHTVVIVSTYVHDGGSGNLKVFP